MSKTLMDNLLTIQRCNNEVESILYNIEILIKSILNNITNIDDDKSIALIKSLFEIQESVAFVVFKFNHKTSDFLYNFIYDFERYDEYAAKYVFDKYISSKRFQGNNTDL